MYISGYLITNHTISAPFAVADLMSSDFFEVLMKIGGQ